MVEIKKLNARVSKLNLDALSGSTSSRSRKSISSAQRDKRLPDRDSTSKRGVTPDVAATTAAALNAERWAQKLKTALLKVREEPLLNTSASVAPAAPKAFESPQRSGPHSDSPSSMNLEGLHMNQPQPPSSPPQSTTSVNAGRGRSPRSGSHSGRTHGHSVPLNRSGGPGSRRSPTPPTGFDWGPLPTVKPASTLAFDLRSTPAAGRS